MFECDFMFYWLYLVVKFRQSIFILGFEIVQLRMFFRQFVELFPFLRQFLLKPLEDSTEFLNFICSFLEFPVNLVGFLSGVTEVIQFLKYFLSHRL